MADSNPRATTLPPPVYHVTSHDPETGKSVFKSEPLEAEPDNKIPQTTLWHLHTTTTFPANLNDEVDLKEHYANNVPSMNTLHKSGGTVVIQRGVMHGWKTAGDEPVRMLFVLSDAQPVEVAGETKGTYLPLDKMPESTRKAMGG
ncbi:hypothetical protein VdG1_05831 [Verticillium dahliae VDG1]|nr:hypothetical protein VdG1_05831 [Verticillium dahliae VDG1]